MLPELKTLAERFTWARKRAGLSQVALADKLKVSQQSIEKLENGHVEKPKYLKEASGILEVTYQWLLTGERDWAEEQLEKLRLIEDGSRSSFEQILANWPKRSS